MTVDAAFLRVSRYAGQEGVAYLVVFSGGCNLLGNRVFMLRQKVLGKAGEPRLGAAIGYVQMVKNLRDACSSPEFKLQTCFLFNIGL